VCFRDDSDNAADPGTGLIPNSSPSNSCTFKHRFRFTNSPDNVRAPWPGLDRNSDYANSYLDAGAADPGDSSRPLRNEP
jgi:hypothetical protein